MGKCCKACLYGGALLLRSQPADNFIFRENSHVQNRISRKCVTSLHRRQIFPKKVYCSLSKQRENIEVKRIVLTLKKSFRFLNNAPSSSSDLDRVFIAGMCQTGFFRIGLAGNQHVSRHSLHVSWRRPEAHSAPDAVYMRRVMATVATATKRLNSKCERMHVAWNGTGGSCGSEIYIAVFPLQKINAPPLWRCFRCLSAMTYFAPGPHPRGGILGQCPSNCVVSRKFVLK